MNIPELKYDRHGLVPAIIQDAENREVLMMAYMNAEAFARTVETGYTHFWSRSRNTLWKKGESSGHVQEVRQILYDCDKDTVLIKVIQQGPGACHTGHRSCFYTDISGSEIAQKVFSEENVYGRQ